MMSEWLLSSLTSKFRVIGTRRDKPGQSPAVNNLLPHYFQLGRSCNVGPQEQMVVQLIWNGFLFPMPLSLGRNRQVTHRIGSCILLATYKINIHSRL